MEVVKVFTDGSCNNRKGMKGSKEGGYGIVICPEGQDQIEYFTGCFINTTSSRMEIRAVLRTLQIIKPGYHIQIYSDSQYVVNTFNKGWLKSWVKRRILNQKANSDLWQEIYNLWTTHEKKGTKFEINWIRGHVGHPLNELADELANKGRLMKTKIDDSQ